MSEEKITVGSFWIQSQGGAFEAVRISDFNKVAKECNSLFDELAALREELAECQELSSARFHALYAVEQRNAELVELLREYVSHTKPTLDALLAIGGRENLLLADKINCGHPARYRAINNPTESGASE